MLFDRAIQIVADGEATSCGLYRRFDHIGKGQFSVFFLHQAPAAQISRNGDGRWSDEIAPIKRVAVSLWKVRNGGEHRRVHCCPRS